ncbi:MAG: RelA/SpoT family protein, partial [Acidimicrobiia bacterium]
MTVLDTPNPAASSRRRVLPWRRQQTDVAIAPLLATFRQHYPKGNTSAIEAAFEFARKAHDGQVRRSGEAYLSHPLGVAAILAELGLDETAICAALLHDAVEDTSVTLEDIESEVGPAVAQLVDGVTKLDRMLFASREEQHAATVRKLVLAMARDVRVLLVKLADRLHNMKTLASLPSHRQERIARETMDVYAPLAHRLGVGELKWQLEDLSFAVLYPKRYAEIESMVALRTPRREETIASVVAEVRECLVAAGIKSEVIGRPKHYWSIYEKMVVKERDFDEVWDLIGLRITVESVKDCYGALGAIHAIWTPMSGRFKDYIATPKFNLYQSLHTTVLDGAGRVVELQIRTDDMHRRAEFGIAAHWQYKDANQDQADAPWMRRLVDNDEDADTPTQFLEQLKGDLEVDEIVVFTPKGRLVQLPVGATPVDFAYAIHTEIGHRCIGAKVNGRLVPREVLLTSGDTIEIFTSKVDGAGPNEVWLEFMVTPRGRSKVRQWFSRERRVDAPEIGQDLLARALA